MVAAHDWDVHGAMAAGLLGAYVARPRTPYHPAFRLPTVRGADLLETVDAILEARVGT
jgi:2-haloacid dehalogenase